ncbi:unnamed protein product [Sphagnum compactum]
MGSRGPTAKLMGRHDIDPRFNRGNKLRPKYESPLDQQENMNQEPIKTAPKSTRLRPPMQNLAFDPRVIRGTLSHKYKYVEEPPSKPHRQKPQHPMQFGATPEPIIGRQHMDVQTDIYLEDQYGKKTFNDFDTQTDPFLDRPATPYFIPWKSGPDAFTQIFDGDLFDFEMEVEPMLEVLVGRALEQGLMEVQEEKQLEHLRCHQDRFEQLRVAELTATQRMEASERRAMEEKDRRVAQERKRLKEEEILRLKVEALGIARLCLKNVTDEVYAALTKAGYFYDPVERELETVFVPKLLQGMQTEIADIVQSRHAVAIMVDEVVPPPDTAERVADGVDMVMARLMNVLDSWITFEDNVMQELDAAEHATHNVMLGIVGEVELVENTSTSVTSSILDRVGIRSTETASASQDLLNSMIGHLQQ